MVKANTPTNRKARQNPQESLILLRIRELDREFARQSKQLSALTKRLGKKLNEPIVFTRTPKR